MRSAIAALMLLLVACGTAPAGRPELGATPRIHAQARADYLRIYGGLEGAYRVILESTDCAELQELFYTATENETLGYQAAATDRAADLGCPELRFTRP